MVVSLWVVMRGFLGASSSSSISQRAGDGCDGLREEPPSPPSFPPSPIAIAADRDENEGEDTVYN